MDCTKLNCPMQAGTVTENCGENCPWRTTAKISDLISRAEAKQAFYQYKKDKKVRTPFEVNRIFDLSEIINSLPAVDAAPVRHGRWVEEPDRVQHYHCSECGVVWGVSSKAMRYCPNCGAKMGNCALWDMETEGTNNEVAID